MRTAFYGLLGIACLGAIVGIIYAMIVVGWMIAVIIAVAAIAVGVAYLLFKLCQHMANSFINLVTNISNGIINVVTAPFKRAKKPAVELGEWEFHDPVA